VVPALHHLSQAVDARIFQELTALEVIGEVLDGHGVYAETRTLEVERAPAVREYCVQYHESDLAFVMRLMEEEGIWFYFRHDEDDGEERLVLTDHVRSLAPVPTLDGEAAPVAGPESATLSVESVRFFDLGRELRSTGTAARDFDWTRPGLDLTRAEPSDPGARAVYEYPAELTIGQYQDPSYGADDGAAQARVRQEARAATGATAAARTNLIGARAGAVLELVGHGDPAHDGRYLVLRVEHHGAVPDAVAGTTRAEPRGDRERYRNELVCAPLDVPHRPERHTTKPRVFGMQTATVVGPAGEEIYTDEHGRVKAQFHWDRLGARNEKSSCWIRVMQAWAGPGWGSVFLPRIGMEVVVNFLEGNPDRPLVIGCVYNGVNRPPYPLPDEKTKSTVKSNSSPGGGGSNEIRFEDLAGSEEVYLHAQKDLNEVVENNHTTTVHANQTDTVDGNQTISVGGDQTEGVDQNVTVHIKGSQSVTIDGTMQGDGHPVTGAGLNITGKYKVDASDTIEVQAPTHIKLTCGGSSILIEPGKITLTAGGNAKVVLDANALMQSAAVSKVFLDASANVHASTGADLLLDPNATLTSNAGSQVALDANAVVAAVAGAFLELTADALLKGANATMNADTAATVSAPTATLQGAAGSVEASGSGVAASGPQVNIAGQGAVNISGSVVKIN